MRVRARYVLHECMVCEGIVEYMKERSSADWKPPPAALLVLTKDNFTELTTYEDLIIVMFYAPWLADFSCCGLLTVTA